MPPASETIKKHNTTMVETVKVFCKNNGKAMEVAAGSLLAEVYEQAGLTMEYGPICARVNNKVEGMHYRVYNTKEVEFLDITSPSGSRAYTRSLFLVLCKAAHDLFPDCKVSIDIPVSNGYYAVSYTHLTLPTKRIV